MKQKLHKTEIILFILLAISGLLNTTVHAAEKKNKERLAVLDLEAKYGIPKDFAEGLSVIVRDKIHSYGDFQVMSQDDIQAVASREQLKQALGCDDGSGQCLIDFGRQIGTRFMVAGSVSKFGATYTVSLRMLDTQGDNAGVVNRVSENCKCSEDDLIGTVQNVAASLVGKKNNEAAKKAAEEAKRLAEEKKKIEEAERQRQTAIAEEQRKVEAEKQKLAAESERLKKEKEKTAAAAAAKKAEEDKQKLAAETEQRRKEKDLEMEAEQKRLAELLQKEDIAIKMKAAEKKEPKETAVVSQRISSSPAGKIFKDPTTSMEFVLIPAGCFQMGDTLGDGNPAEKPVHEVCVDEFYIGKFEVTQEEYQKIMKVNPAASKKGDRYPVESVSWITAQDFINALRTKSGKNYRLPTEAEWEYAAKAGGNLKYAGSNDVNAVAWYIDNSNGSTQPVGQKQPNAFGLYDMSGNVWEWCGDWFSAGYYKTSPRNKPDGPLAGSGRVNRGGSWDGNARKIRTTNRDAYAPDRGFNNIGFRILLPAQ